jgi:predicted DNA-binding protein with PD1-like motif
MKQKLLDESGGQRTFAVVLDTGDEVLGCLTSFVNEHRIGAAQITAIGAFSEVVLKYFDWESKQYEDNKVNEQVEVASLLGDVATAPSGEAAIHIHVVVGKRDGSAMAGHLGTARVRPTLEILLEESPAHLQKRSDPQSGLALIRLDR